MVVYDTAPLTGKRYQNNPFISSRAQLEQLLAELVADGLVIDAADSKPAASKPLAEEVH
jgi:hypothetical protein